MAHRLLKLLKNWRVLLLLTLLLLALSAIRPSPQNDGVAIRAVLPNSSAADAGMHGPAPKAAPLSLERITGIDGQQISTPQDYHDAIAQLQPNQTIRIITNRASYLLAVKPLYRETPLNGTELRIVEELDPETNTSVNRTVEVPKVLREVTGAEDPGLRVVAAAGSNLRKGLDLVGGSRVVLQPAESISDEDLATTTESLTQRLNIYGLSDVVVRDASDLAGNRFIVVEIAGITEDEVRGIIASQGKFEAKISNQTVFTGGRRDITYVCRSAGCSGLDTQRPCSQSGGGWFCGFFFQISLSVDAAKRHADGARSRAPFRRRGGLYVSAPLELYLDDRLVDTLQIAASLKGQEETAIAISGSGSGRTRQEAVGETLQQMKRLQTVLITGSLPVKLNVVKIDTISPILGERFLRNLMLIGAVALLTVTLSVAARYRNAKIAAPMIFTMISEIVLILGFAAMVGWNLDIAAMAGIIISVGTAVDHLIVITDETLRSEIIIDWKKRLGNAMFIITGAYLTVLAGMLPLWFAGAGLLKGFAFTTIVGVSVGVLIARPAYAAMIRILLQE